MALGVVTVAALEGFAEILIKALTKKVPCDCPIEDCIHPDNTKPTAAGSTAIVAAVLLLVWGVVKLDSISTQVEHTAAQVSKLEYRFDTYLQAAAAGGNRAAEAVVASPTPHIWVHPPDAGIHIIESAEAVEAGEVGHALPRIVLGPSPTPQPAPAPAASTAPTAPTQ